MGIPYYFSYLLNSNKDIIKRINILRNKDTKIQLYFDLNCLIHPVCEKIIKYYNVEVGKQLDEEKLEVDMIQSVIKNIEKLCDLIQPSDLIYIAIDGVPPLAKIKQQRNRRYLSIYRRKLLDKYNTVKNNKIYWDKNAITPGTKFMDKLDIKLKDFLINRFKYKKNVEFSLSDEPGEGEHKIFERIRSIKSSDDEIITVIYGLDADLIMLSICNSLQLNRKNFYLLRENSHIRSHIDEEFILLDINILIIQIFQNFKRNIQHEITTRILYDYIFIFFLLGNDFIPKPASINIRNKGIDILLNIYIDIFNNINEYLITKEYNINQRFILQIFKILSENESKYGRMNHIYFTKLKLPKKRNTMTEDEYIQLMVDYSPILNKELNIDMLNKNWRKRYYRYHLKLNDLTNTKMIKKMVYDYIKCLKWVTMYYFKGIKNHDVYYHFYVSPLFTDIYINIKLALELIDIKKTQSVSRKELLRIVLPRESYSLLNHYNYMENVLDYIPIKANIDMSYKKYLHECDMLLPIKLI